MPLGSASDLAFMLQDAGVAVVYNGVTTFGILDMAAALEPLDQGGMAQVRVTTLLVATDAFPALRNDGRLTADGIPYRVDRFEPEEDGALTRVYVARLS